MSPRHHSTEQDDRGVSHAVTVFYLAKEQNTDLYLGICITGDHGSRCRTSMVDDRPSSLQTLSSGPQVGYNRYVLRVLARPGCVSDRTHFPWGGNLHITDQPTDARMWAGFILGHPKQLRTSLYCGTTVWYLVLLGFGVWSPGIQSHCLALAGYGWLSALVSMSAWQTNSQHHAVGTYHCKECFPLPGQWWNGLPDLGQIRPWGPGPVEPFSQATTYRIPGSGPMEGLGLPWILEIRSGCCNSGISGFSHEVVTGRLVGQASVVSGKRDSFHGLR